MKTSDRIKEFAKERALTLSEVADRAGLSLHTLKHIVYGHNLCGVATAKKLAPVLGVNWPVLVGD